MYAACFPHISLIQLYTISIKNLVMVVILLGFIFCLASRKSEHEIMLITVPRLHVANTY